MGLTISITDKLVFGNKKVRLGTVTFDSSYPTGGEAYTAGLFGLSKLRKVRVDPKGGYTFDVDTANSTIKVFGVRIDSTSTGIIRQEEMSNGTDLSSVVAEFEVYGYGG
jgi:hypothetical protein